MMWRKTIGFGMLRHIPQPKRLPFLNEHPQHSPPLRELSDALRLFLAEPRVEEAGNAPLLVQHRQCGVFSADNKSGGLRYPLKGFLQRPVKPQQNARL
ncbi:MAG: hypothetical protein C4295_09350 [Candidatus Fervidibacterota bacterium]